MNKYSNTLSLLLQRTKKSGNVLWFLLAILLTIFIVAPFYGALPLGNVNSLGAIYTALGSIDCLAKMGLCTPCSFAGFPLGVYMPFGLSYAYISSALIVISGISVVNAYNITGILFLFIGWIGVFFLIRSFGGNKFLSFLGGFLFLFMPILWGKSGYIFMMWAFVAIPFFIWLDIWYFQTKRFLVSLPLVFFSKIFLVFMEPYTFVMASLFTCAIILYETITVIKLKPFIYKRILKIFFISISPLFAYLLYKIYIPGGANYSVMPLDFFRGQGIDLISFFNRYSGTYAIGQFWNVSIPNPRLFYTDGESVRHVYLGLGILSIVPLLIIFGSRLSPKHWLFLCVGIITLFLSLGPSLKINDQRDPSQIVTENITFNDYQMPEQSATLSMPYSLIYKVSPFKYMRSVSRWLLPTILACVVTLMVLLTYLWNYDRRGKILAFLLIILVIIEYAPNYKYRIAQIQYETASFNKFNSTALQDFKSNIKQDDLVLFIQDGGISNEYFSTYLCSEAQCSSYNVSTDKAIELSVKQWPKQVYDVTLKPEKKTVIELLKSKLVTVIVCPHFDMRWNSYSWPPDQATKNRFSDFANQFQYEGQNVEFRSDSWFSYLRLKKQ